MKKPSVSQLLDLLAKPALIGWANRQGLAGIDIEVQRREAKLNGTSLHSQVESANKGILDFMDPQHEEAYLYFMEGKEVLSVETRIETEWFTGRYDAKLRFKGLDYIVDYKTGFTKSYLEHKLQLAAYQMAEKACGIAIVSVPDFTLHPMKLNDPLKYYNLLVHLSKIYYLKKEIENV